MAIKILELNYLQDTAKYAHAVSDMENPVWLDSSDNLELGGRFDIITASPHKVIEAHGGRIEIRSTNDGATKVSQLDAFDAVREQLKSIAPDAEHLPEHIPFAGGALGYWGYGLGAKAQHSTTGLPDMRVGIYLWSVVVDRLEMKAWLCLHDACEKALADELRKRFCVGVQEPLKGKAFSIEPFAPRITREQYCRSIDSIREYISAGDCYQVNYSQEFVADCRGDNLSAYLGLRGDAPAHYSAYLGFNDGAILSASPECFLTLAASGKVTTKPIKGTAPRHTDTARDALSAHTLAASEKDLAENLMIVDLMRNDLGRQCEKGSVSVDALCKLESFSNVHHLVSEVTGELAAGADALSLLGSAFPAGSITGAPKSRAMEIIDELETQPRSVYCGSIGYVGFDGAMDVSVAIRTLEISAGKVFCRGGGGIVFDSGSESEYQETLDKVGSIMNCLERRFGDAAALAGDYRKNT